VDVDGGHGAFGGGDDGELGLWGDVAGGVDAGDARLLCFVYPHQTAFRIEVAAERFVEVRRELGAEIEEQRVALERLTVREDYTLQLLLRLVTVEGRNGFCSDRDIKPR